MANKGFNKISFLEFHKRLAVNQLQRHLQLQERNIENGVQSNNAELLGTFQRIDWGHYRARLQNSLNKVVADCVCGLQGMWQNFRYEQQLANTKRTLLQLANSAQTHLTRTRSKAIEQDQLSAGKDVERCMEKCAKASKVTLSSHQEVEANLTEAIDCKLMRPQAIAATEETTIAVPAATITMTNRIAATTPLQYQSTSSAASQQIVAIEMTPQPHIANALQCTTDQCVPATNKAERTDLSLDSKSMPAMPTTAAAGTRSTASSDISKLRSCV